MAETVRIDVQPELLEWAIRRRRTSVEELREKAALRQLDKWIEGTTKPTFRQLEDFAKAVNVPLGFLFLQAPPDISLPLPDFRKKKGIIHEKPSPELQDAIFDAMAMQDWLREYLEGEGESPKNFVGSIRIETHSVKKAAKKIESDAGLEMHADWKGRNFASWRKAFRFLCERFSRLGIIVIVRGVVRNNTRRPLDPEEFRGFAIADPFAPLVFVNSNDYQAAQIYTLLHEVVHIWTGHSGVSDWLGNGWEGHSEGVENFCNQVAAEILLPEDVFREKWRAFDRHPPTEPLERVKELARYFKASSLSVAIRGKTLKLMSHAAFMNVLDKLKKEYKKEKEKTRTTGGNFYATQLYRLGGEYFIDNLRRALGEGKLSYKEAFRLTHLYGTTFDKCLEQLTL